MAEIADESLDLTNESGFDRFRRNAADRALVKQVQAAIGLALKDQYDTTQPLPDHFVGLLEKLSIRTAERAAGGRTYQIQAA